MFTLDVPSLLKMNGFIGKRDGYIYLMKYFYISSISFLNWKLDAFILSFFKKTYTCFK